MWKDDNAGLSKGSYGYLHRAHIHKYTQTDTNTASSSPGEMSENGAEVEIQSFLSDGTVLPRETEMRAPHFACSNRLCAQPCIEKTPFATQNQVKLAHIKNRESLQSQHASASLYGQNSAGMFEVHQKRNAVIKTCTVWGDLKIKRG